LPQGPAQLSFPPHFYLSSSFRFVDPPQAEDDNRTLAAQLAEALAKAVDFERRANSADARGAGLGGEVDALRAQLKDANSKLLASDADGAKLREALRVAEEEAARLRVAALAAGEAARLEEELARLKAALASETARNRVIFLFCCVIDGWSTAFVRLRNSDPSPRGQESEKSLQEQLFVAQEEGRTARRTADLQAAEAASHIRALEGQVGVKLWSAFDCCTGQQPFRFASWRGGESRRRSLEVRHFVDSSPTSPSKFRLDTIAAKLRAAEDGGTALRAANQRLERTVGVLEDDKSRLSERLRNVEADASTKSAELRALGARLETAKSAFEGERSKLAAALASSDAKRQELEALVREYQTRERTFQSSLGVGVEDLVLTRQRVSDLQASWRQREAMLRRHLEGTVDFQASR
jgi:septal ring factor EnvC (AmiA/AmiB activator)